MKTFLTRGPSDRIRDYSHTSIKSPYSYTYIYFENNGTGESELLEWEMTWSPEKRTVIFTVDLEQ